MGFVSMFTMIIILAKKSKLIKPKVTLPVFSRPPSSVGFWIIVEFQSETGLSTGKKGSLRASFPKLHGNLTQMIVSST
jgi:hypothetical protein